MNRPKRHLNEVDSVASKRPHTESISSAKDDYTIIEPVVYNRPGTVLVLGTGDTGQLGLGPDISERTRPAKFTASSIEAAGFKDDELENFIQVVAGGMHTVCLTADGFVYTFGCNDEGALGRLLPANTDEPETRPGKVKFSEDVRIKMVSAGDSHSAALDTNGSVWVWGTFRGASGPIGLTKTDEISKLPVKLAISNAFGHNRHSKVAALKKEKKIIKIASGQDHLVMLTDEGKLLSMGCGEQGQLGRIAERFCKDGGRSGLDHLLLPAECRVRGNIRFNDLWAGGFATFARCAVTGSIYACGLNNYGQLSLLKASPEINHKNVKALSPDFNQNPAKATKLSETEAESDLVVVQGPLIQYMLTEAEGYDPTIVWKQIAVSMHHTLSLDVNGNVYASGRREYGRLGLGQSNSKDSVVQPEKISFEHLKLDQINGEEQSASVAIAWIAVGEACSYAVERGVQGRCFAWGMGNNNQLGQEDADDDLMIPQPMKGKNLVDRRVVLVDAGGQHTVLLAQHRDAKPKFNGIDRIKEANLDLESTNGKKMDLDELRPTSQSSPFKNDDSAVAQKASIGQHRQVTRAGTRHKSGLDAKSPEGQHGQMTSTARHEFRAPASHQNSSVIRSRKRRRGVPSQEAPEPTLNLSSSSETSSIASRISQTPTTPGKFIPDAQALLLDCNHPDMGVSRRLNQSSSSTAAPSPPASTVGSVLDLISTAATINTSDAASTILDDEEDASSIASTQYSSVPAILPCENNIAPVAQPPERRTGRTTVRGGSVVTAPPSRSQLRGLKPKDKLASKNGGLHGTGMSLTSTSSELGLPDTVSLGSMTASPSCCCGEAMSGDASSL